VNLAAAGTSASSAAGLVSLAAELFGCSVADLSENFAAGFSASFEAGSLANSGGSVLYGNLIDDLHSSCFAVSVSSVADLIVNSTVEVSGCSAGLLVYSAVGSFVVVAAAAASGLASSENKQQLPDDQSPVKLLTPV